MTSQPKIENVCYYHAECVDGWVAALAVWYYLEGDVTLIPAIYNVTEPVARDCNVYIVDFCFDADTTCNLIAENHHVTIYDHHATAKPILLEVYEWVDLENMQSNFSLVFDKERSGALIAWETLNRDYMPPWVSMVSDRDLWKFEDSYSAAFYAGMMQHPMTLDKFWIDLIEYQEPEMVSELIVQGNAIIQARDNNIAMLIKYARPIVFQGHVVPIVNCPRFIGSEALDTLGRNQPFAIGWHEDGDHYKFSFRAPKDSTVDLTDLLAPFGGGGHPTASGMRLPINGRSVDRVLQDLVINRQTFKDALKLEGLANVIVTCINVAESIFVKFRAKLTKRD